MYNNTDLKGMLFIDIETAAADRTLSHYADRIPGILHHWSHKASLIRKGNSDYTNLTDGELFVKDAALYAEFGKVLVISIGQIIFEADGTPTSKILSLYGDDESIVLNKFMKVINSVFATNPNIKITGHAIKGFDIPYLLKRSMVNGIAVPQQLHLHKLKPWENCLLDTSDLWKFGSWGGASSLSLLCDILKIPSPKENMTGNEVNCAYWDGRLEEIKNYCEDDVTATMNLMLKISGLDIIEK